MGGQLRAVGRDERATNSFVGDQTGEAVENSAQNIVGRNALLDGLDQPKELPKFRVSFVQGVGEQEKFMAELGQGVARIEWKPGHRLSRA